MSVTVGQVTAMTVITPIKPDKAADLRKVLQDIQASPDKLLQKINTIHYARWVIIDEGKRLLFTSNFDGTADQYLKQFVDMLPQGLDAIWGNCVGYPGAKPIEPFLQYVRAHEVDASLFYASYPDVTVGQVQKGIRVLQRFQGVLDEFK